MTKTYHILLVENSYEDFVVIENALRETGKPFELHVASTGEDAMSILHNHTRTSDAFVPSLIVLDLSLPSVPGLSVLAAIKSDPSLKRIPVVALTKSENEEEVTAAYDLHVNSLIVKPAETAQLEKAVRVFARFWFEIVKLPPPLE